MQILLVPNGKADSSLPTCAFNTSCAVLKEEQVLGTDSPVSKRHVLGGNKFSLSANKLYVHQVIQYENS